MEKSCDNCKALQQDIHYTKYWCKYGHPIQCVSHYYGIPAKYKPLKECFERMPEELKEAIKKNINKGLLTSRWECLSFAIGYLEKNVGHMPFEVIEYIDMLYMDDYISK